MEIRSYTDFSGGINTLIGPLVIDQGQAPGFFYADDAQNFQMMPNGLLKFPGFGAVLASPLPGRVTGLFEYNNNGTLELIACAAGNVYKISGSSATSLYTGGTAGKNYQGLIYQNQLILMNGADTPLIYNGSTCVATSPIDPGQIWNNFKPQGACEFRNRIFYWGDPASPDKIITPRPNTVNNFDNNQGTVDGFLIAPGFGGKITGLRALTDDFMTVYKERCIRRVLGSAPFNTGPDPFQIHAVSDELGCVAPGTIVPVGLDQYFFSQTGLKHLQPQFTYGNIQTQDPTYVIQDVISGFNFTNNIINQACMAFDQINNRLALCLPSGGSTTNDTVFNYNVATHTNEPRGTGMNASAIGYYNRQIYHGDYNGQIYRHGLVNSYNGNAYTGYWRSKYVAHGGIGTLKAYRKLVLYAEAQSTADIIVQWSILKRGSALAGTTTERVGSINLWDIGKWDQTLWSGDSGSTFEIKNLGKGKAIQLQLSNTSNTQLPKIRGIELHYDILGTAKG